jgi:hypothetical protein
VLLAVDVDVLLRGVPLLQPLAQLVSGQPGSLCCVLFEVLKDGIFVLELELDKRWALPHLS